MSNQLQTSNENKFNLKEWIKTPKGRLISLISLALIAVIIAGSVTLARYAKERQSGETQTNGNLLTAIKFGGDKNKEDKKVASQLDGTLVPEDHAKRRPLAVMVENHPDARPQFGLDKASVVFEAIAEGGITRFLALFGSFNVDKIGPIRSARPYFVEWASGWKALYAHAGGSEGGLAMIKKASVVDLQHNQSAFWRETRGNIASEHTLYTSTEKLYNYASQKKASVEADFSVWKFENDPDTAERGTQQKVTIDFSSPSYKVEWVYDQAQNKYLRNLAGAPHEDGNSKDQLAAKNVILAIISRQNNPNVNQGKGEWTMNTIGEGKAKILKYGRLIDGVWKKPSLSEMIKFYDGDGKELSLVRGLTWIEVVPPDVGVNIE